MEINGKEIYDRIVEMITMRGIKKSDFYNKLGITRQHLSRWKSGSLPTIDIIYKIKDELQVSLEWLLTGNNEQDANDPAAPYKIVDRIDYYIQDTTHHMKYEPSIVFYNILKDIVSANELPDWFYGRQTIDISKLSKIADKLGKSVQYFITGSDISKEEYTKYYGNKDSNDTEFYKQFSCLNDKTKEIVKHIVYLYFREQIG